MTFDVPSVLVLATAIVVHLRVFQRALFAGAALMGLGINLRDDRFYVPGSYWHPSYVVGNFNGEKCCICSILFCVSALALGWFAYWFVTDPTTVTFGTGGGNDEPGVEPSPWLFQT